MTKNNLKLLSVRQRIALNEKYIFSYDKDRDVVKVKIKDYNRETIHDAKEKFFINSKIRKITFTPEAIEIWQAILEKGHCYTLVDVQCVINEIYVLYQKPSISLALKILKKEIKEKEGIEENETN